MTSHEWKTLAAFGALAGALALFDSKLALQAIGLAALVVLVKNANKLPLPGGATTTSSGGSHQ